MGSYLGQILIEKETDSWVTIISWQQLSVITQNILSLSPLLAQDIISDYHVRQVSCTQQVCVLFSDITFQYTLSSVPGNSHVKYMASPFSPDHGQWHLHPCMSVVYKVNIQEKKSYMLSSHVLNMLKGPSCILHGHHQSHYWEYTERISIFPFYKVNVLRTREPSAFNIPGGEWLMGNGD